MAVHANGVPSYFFRPILARAVKMYGKKRLLAQNGGKSAFSTPILPRGYRKFSRSQLQCLVSQGSLT
jgi:hypothetical protein